MRSWRGRGRKSHQNQVFLRHSTAFVRPRVEAMEPRQLLANVVVTSMGPAHDSFGDSTSGWTGLLLSLKAEPGYMVTAVDMGQSASSVNGIFGTLLQNWSHSKSGDIPSPVGVSVSDTNGSNNGTDSHVLVLQTLLVSAPFEDMNGVHPTGAPANTSQYIWGTGTYLRGVFAVLAGAQANTMPLAYLVVKNNTIGSYIIDLAESANGLQKTFHLEGTFGSLLPGTGSVAGNIYNDVDGDAVRDLGDPGIKGATVFLDKNKNGSLDSGESTQTTDTAGHYVFEGLPVGTYRVRKNAASGTRITSPLAGYFDVTVTGGAKITARDFGQSATAQITGAIYNDLDSDGLRDAGEPGFSGWKVFLDANANRKFDTGETSVLTDSSGLYKFIIAPPAANTVFRVGEVVPAGWRSLSADPEASGVVLSPGKTVANWNIANVVDTRAVTFKGNVMNDVDGNQPRGFGDRALANERVYVDSNNNSKWDSGETAALTSATGSWQMILTTPAGTNAPTRYYVRHIVRSGWRPSVPAVGAALEVVAVPGELRDQLQFLDTQRVLVSGNIFNDVNKNGSQDEGERGLGGWQVYADENGDGIWQSTEANTRTDAKGEWSIGTLVAGTSIRIRVVRQTGWTRTSGPPIAFTLTNGAIETGMLLGVHKD